MKRVIRCIYSGIKHIFTTIKNECNNSIPKIFGAERKPTIFTYNIVFTLIILFANIGNYINYLNPPSG